MPPFQAIRIINVPSDIGSMIKGKSLAPEAFQAADLAGTLTKVGYDVEESNALPDRPRVWTFDAEISENGVRNEEANVEVNRRVKEAVSRVLQQSNDSPVPFPLVIGGECNIVPAILSAFCHTLPGKTIGLLYLDGDCDLTLPNEPGASYNLASMTFTHLTMREGALESMKPFTRPDGKGVCDAGNTVLFGLNAALQGNTRPQLAYLFDEGYRVFTSSTVARDPVGAAEKALAWFEAQGVDCFLLHLDVMLSMRRCSRWRMWGIAPGWGLRACWRRCGCFWGVGGVVGCVLRRLIRIMIRGVVWWGLWWRSWLGGLRGGWRWGEGC